MFEIFYQKGHNIACFYVVTDWVCYPPDNFPNGNFDPAQPYYEEGDSLWFECDKNYVLQGESDLYCEENGIWSDEFPICEGKTNF